MFWEIPLTTQNSLWLTLLVKAAEYTDYISAEG